MSKTDNAYEVIIVGGGGAAMAAAIYTGRGGRKTLVLERAIVGGQIFGTTDVENYPGFPDGVDGPEIADLMQKQAEKFGAEIRFEEVSELRVDGWTRTVVTSKGEYTAPIVIVATGSDPRKLDVPGEMELLAKGVSYCATCDGPFFKDKKLVVVGGGDSAFKESLYLTKFASELVLVHRRQGFRAEQIYIDQARNNETVRFQLDTIVEKVLGDDKVTGVRLKNVKTDEVFDEACDGVFVFVGHIPNTDWVKDVLELNERGEIKTNMHMETNVEGVYAVGDVRADSYRQLGTAVGEGITAAMAAEHLLSDLEAKGVR